LSGLSYFPQDEGAVGQLLKAMMEAPTREAAEGFVDSWTLTQRKRECPKPGDIFDYFHPPDDYNLSSPKNTGCPVCGGSGWIWVEKGGFSCVKKCACIAAA